MRYELVPERREFCRMNYHGDRMTVVFLNRFDPDGDADVMHGAPEEFVQIGVVQVSEEVDDTLVDLRATQAEVNSWAEHNFVTPNLSPEDQKALIALTGVAEEAGEVVRAIRKMCQGIRGTREEWIEEIEKEGADVVIQLMSGFNALGLDLNNAVRKRWASVSQRDWKKFPKNGVDQ